MGLELTFTLLMLGKTVISLCDVVMNMEEVALTPLSGFLLDCFVILKSCETSGLSSLTNHTNLQLSSSQKDKAFPDLCSFEKRSSN